MSAFTALLLSVLQDPQGADGAREIVLVAPVHRFEDAIPLGTGRLGVLVRAEGTTLFLALDRPDLEVATAKAPALPRWSDLVALVAGGSPERIRAMFAEPAREAGTEPAVARIELPVEHAVLRLRAELATGDVVVECTGASLRIHAPLESEFVLVESRGTAFAIAGEESATTGGRWSFASPKGAVPAARLVGVRTSTATGALAALSLVGETGGPDPVPAASARAVRLVGAGFAAATERSRNRWQAMSEASSVRLPEPRLQALYDLARFLLIAGSQPVGVPLGPAGPWSAAAGGPRETAYECAFALPACYLGSHALGVESTSEPLFAWLVQRRDAFRTFAKDHFGAGGLLVPGNAALDGSARGAAFDALAPTRSVWFVQAFWSQWRYLRQRGFLEDTAYPWCREVGVALEDLLGASRGGALRLPFALTPVPHDGPTMLLASPSTQDVALLRWLFGALATMALELGEREDVRRWQRVLDRLDPLERDPKSAALLVAHGVPFSPVARSFGHAVAIHPLGLVAVESSAEQRKTVLATLGEIEQGGLDALTGTELAWYAALCARADQGEPAAAALQRFERTCVGRSGLHLLPARTGSRPAARHFAIAGNLLVLEAVHQMLLRSQSGIVQVFPAVPASWRDLAFTDLRAEGAMRVSARRENAKTVLVTLHAEKGGVVKLADPFPGRTAVWSGEFAPKRTSWGFELALRAGESVTASAR